jgi:hypothetical protein
MSRRKKIPSVRINHRIKPLLNKILFVVSTLEEETFKAIYKLYPWLNQYDVIFISLAAFNSSNPSELPIPRSNFKKLFYLKDMDIDKTLAYRVANILIPVDIT